MKLNIFLFLPLLLLSAGCVTCKQAYKPIPEIEVRNFKTASRLDNKVTPYKVIARFEFEYKSKYKLAALDLHIDDQEWDFLMDNYNKRMNHKLLSDNQPNLGIEVKQLPLNLKVIPEYNRINNDSRWYKCMAEVSVPCNYFGLSCISIELAGESKPVSYPLNPYTIVITKPTKEKKYLDIRIRKIKPVK